MSFAELALGFERQFKWYHKLVVNSKLIAQMGAVNNFD
jgi:hypothetical protein